MKPKTKAILIAFLFPIITIPGLFWLGGFDFNARGEIAFGCALATLIVTVVLVGAASDTIKD